MNERKILSEGREGFYVKEERSFYVKEVRVLLLYSDFVYKKTGFCMCR